MNSRTLKLKPTPESGFTLVEIAIVLVIVGLLLGGVLKGQELINNAKVKNIIQQTDGIKSAFYAFQDRYRGIPGDYARAIANVGPGTAPNLVVNGDGGGTVAAGVEVGQVWLQLGTANLLQGEFDGATETPNTTWQCTVTGGVSGCPVNPFGGNIKLTYGSLAVPSAALTHELTTGRYIPVSLVAEIDRKVDDGNPGTGTFVFGNSGGAAPLATCVDVAATPTVWDIAANSNDCGGLFTRL